MCSNEGWIHLNGLDELIDRGIVLSGVVISRAEMKAERLGVIPPTCPIILIVFKSSGVTVSFEDSFPLYQMSD
jgi:hypothetical protein